MNQNGDEKRIRQLFREMSREDEPRTPEFAAFVSTARLRAGRSQNRKRLFALAWASSLAILLVIVVTLALRHPGTQTQDEPRDQVAEEKQTEKQTIESVPSGTLSVSSTAEAQATAERPVRKRVRRKRSSDDLAIRVKTLFAWQSPTASLLKAPGDETLKSLPRLGESLRSIKIFSPDEFN